MGSLALRVLTVTSVTVCLLTGGVGFRLVPDSFTYASGSPGLWPTPLGWIPGAVGGMAGVVIFSAFCVGGVVYYLGKYGSTRSVAIFAGFLFPLWYFLFPGLDSVGVMFFLAGIIHVNKKLLWIGALFHPVIAFSNIGLWIGNRFRLSLPYCVAAFGLLACLIVGEVDTFSTTARYVIPAAALFALHYA